MGTLLAGVGRATITPPVGILMMGYANRKGGSTSRHDDLVATALVLSDGETRAAIVTCDLVFVHPATVARIRALVCRQTGIPAQHVMLCCSHTHSGPVMRVSEGATVEHHLRSSYLDNLVHLIAGAVDEAHRYLVDAAWGVGRGTVVIGANRRQQLANGRLILGENPEGAVDPELLVLRVDAVEGSTGGNAFAHPTRPLALLANYACHAVCLSSNSYALSADWPGVMRRQVEASTGAMVGFVQGACADVNPIGGPQDTFDSAQRLGAMAGQELLRIYPQVRLQRDATLRVARREIELPLLGPVGPDGRRVPPFDSVAACTLGMPPADALAFLDQRFPWSVDVRLSSDGSGRGEVWTSPVEVQAVCLGDVALVGVAAEPFVEIGLEVKARSAARMTLFAGYANGSIGYLPTPAAYELGGYEVNTSYVYYRLPAPLAPACAGVVIDEMMALVQGGGAPRAAGR